MMALRLLATSRLRSTSAVVTLVSYASTRIRAVVESEKQPCVSRFPTLRELRETLILHAGRVYNSPRVEFDPTRKHDPLVGAQTGIIPLASEPGCWRIYRSPSNRCRFGMILEELDVIAPWVGYKHNQDPAVQMGTPAHHTIGVVTVLVDRIDVTPGAQFRPDQDVTIHGYVSWLGKSSMEVTIDVAQMDTDHIPKKQMAAKFLMVTISPELKSAPNVALVLRDDNDRRLFEQGERARELRAERDKNSVATTMPTFEELNLLRELEFKVIDPLTLTSDYSRVPVGHVLMDGAKLMNTIICMPEWTNLHGQIFGGFLFRTAYETAWSNAAVFANQPVSCTSVTNGRYLRALPVGALLHISSQVCYTRDRSMQTLVTCQVRNAKSNELETAMIFHFTFEADAPVRSLIPNTHADGLRYVHCRRELEFALHKTTLDANSH